MMSFRMLLRFVLIGLVWGSVVSAAVPQLLNHQGRIAVDGVNFQGEGLFKFALVDNTGSTTYWSHDGSSVGGGEPASAVMLVVTKGLYSVLLGDSNRGMPALTGAVLDHEDVRLRVWFNDGSTGWELIMPDQRLAAAPYALVASSVDQVLLSTVVAPPIKPVVAWGKNTNGQTTVPALANVAAIAAGGAQSLALLANGTVIAWGGGTAVPGGLTNVTHLAAGLLHNLVRKSDGTVVAWGDNTYTQSSVPGGISDAIGVAAGEKHSLILRSNGSVTAFGDNSFTQTTVPGTATNVTAIAAGYDHSLALKSDGTVIAWGRNESGQTAVPGGLTNVVAIAAGAYHSLAVKSDGSVVAWGWDLGGQSTVPPGLTGVSKVAGGYAFSVALKTDGTLVTWGDNTDGQSTVPNGTSQITAIAAGASHALALRSALIAAQVARLDQDNVFTEKVGIGRSAATNALEVEGQASKTTAGNWAANSDRRIKTAVQPLTGALQKLDQVRLVDFKYTADYRAAHPGIADKRYLNVIAQEFAKVFPDHVQSSGEKLPDGSEILQVDTYPLTIYSAAAVQELHRENAALKQQLAAQEERLKRLEAAIKP